MKKLIVLCLSLSLFFPTVAYAQSDTASEGSLTVKEQLNNLLESLSTLQSTLKKDRQKRPIARKIKLITKKIIRAVNSIPPEKCMNTLRVAMNDFFGLVSDLGSGISCGPPIIPPFLPGDDSSAVQSLTGDCFLPPDRSIGRLQIGGPFGGAFADVNPVYDKARDLFRIDKDGSKISDVCEVKPD